MNISSSVGPAAIFGQLSTSNVSNKLNTPIKESTRSADANKVEQASNKQASNKQTTSSIVIDEQAIALLEQSQYSALTQAQLSSQLSSKIGEESPSSASRDQPSAKNDMAVANYQAVGNLAQRESVQKLFGVDLFA
tara:strand:+ start:158 stop:565 length:408 start_codon:yes stop_codon:yes gene_type:complete